MSNNPINPNGKQLLLTLSATAAIKLESFRRNGPLLPEMIGGNWLAEQIFLAHQEAGANNSRHTLKQTGLKLDVIENEYQIIIQVS